MKLGKGPTSVLDRHSTLNDITALRLCTRFLFLTLYHELSKVDHNDNDEFFFSLSRAKSSMTFCQAMLLEKKKKKNTNKNKIRSTSNDLSRLCYRLINIAAVLEFSDVHRAY